MAEGGAEPEVVLVDDHDAQVGVAAKLAAHEAPGMLHRVFSVYLFDHAGRLLLQQRATSKYHFAGVWSNTCCSHPRPGEATAEAAGRRIREELGLHCELHPAGTFRYAAADLDSGLVERELDHVFVGSAELDAVVADPDEVADVRAVDPLALPFAMGAERLSPWCLIGLGLAVPAHAALRAR